MITEMNDAQEKELSLEDRIAFARAEFFAACAPGEKRVRWRAWAELIARQAEERKDGKQC